MADKTNRRLADDAKIAFLSPSGWGNLGDTAIIESLIRGVHRRLPHAKVVAFTLNTQGTSLQHQLEAHTLLGYSTRLYTMQEAQASAPEAEMPGPPRSPSALLWLARKVRGVFRRLPGPVREPVALARRLAGELRHLRSSRRLLKGAAALVVAGGGQLDDFFGGPFGQPYALFRWGLLARSVGARFCFASVGTGTLSTLASRWFVRRALSLADYRSFRDDRSRELVGAPALTHLDPTVPDLAYALPVQPEPAPGRPHLCVGLAPMAFCDPRQWPVEDQRRYQRHVRSFGALAKALLAEGHEVVLFTTDNEPGALEDTAAAIGPLTPGRLRIEPASSLPALFRTYAGVDVVVAARLHSTLLAHLAHRPVLAVSHERKVRALMEEMGLGRFCVEIDEFEAQTGLALLHELAAARGQVAAALGAAVEERRRRVEAQYDLLFGEAS